MCSLPSRKWVTAPDAQNEVLKWTAEKFGQRADDEWRSKVLHSLPYACARVRIVFTSAAAVGAREAALVLTGVAGGW